MSTAYINRPSSSVPSSTIMNGSWMIIKAIKKINQEFVLVEQILILVKYNLNGTTPAQISGVEQEIADAATFNDKASANAKLLGLTDDVIEGNYYGESQVVQQQNRHYTTR